MLIVDLAPEHLEACLVLDAAALGGLWSREQWRRELEEAGRPGVGLWHQGQLVAMACGWLIVDELHVTLVAVAPERRRLGLGRQVLEALLRRGRAGDRAGGLGLGGSSLEGATGGGGRGQRFFDV